MKADVAVPCLHGFTRVVTVGHDRDLRDQRGFLPESALVVLKDVAFLAYPLANSLRSGFDDDHPYAIGIRIRQIASFCTCRSQM